MSDGVDRVGVHREHCCYLHGCKYDNGDCPVAAGTVKQSYPCEECGFDEINEVPDPSKPDFDLYEMSESELRDETKKLRDAIRKYLGYTKTASNQSRLRGLKQVLPKNDGRK